MGTEISTTALTTDTLEFLKNGLSVGNKLEVTSSVPHDLKVIDKYHSIIKAIIAGETTADGTSVVNSTSVYVTATNYLKNLLEAGELTPGERAAVIGNVLTQLNTSIVTAGLSTALQWADKELENQNNKFKYAIELSKAAKEVENADALKEKIKAEVIKTYSDNIRENGTPTIDLTNEYKVTGLANEGKAKQETDLLKVKINTEKAQTNVLDADWEVKKLTAYKLGLDTYLSSDHSIKYTITDPTTSDKFSERQVNFSDNASASSVLTTSNRSYDVRKIEQELLKLEEETAAIRLKKYESMAAVHKIAADTAVNFGTMKFRFAGDETVLGIAATQSTSSAPTLTDYQMAISQEQAKGYAYNAWSNAIVATAGLIGQGLSSEAAGFFENGVDADGKEVIGTGNSALQLMQTLMSKFSTIPVPDYTKANWYNAAQYSFIESDAATLLYNVKQAISINIPISALSKGDLIKFTPWQYVELRYTVADSDLTGTSDDEKVAKVASSITAKNYTFPYNHKTGRYTGYITATSSGTVLTITANPDKTITEGATKTEHINNAIGLDSASFKDIAGTAKDAAAPKIKKLTLGDKSKDYIYASSSNTIKLVFDKNLITGVDTRVEISSDRFTVSYSTTTTPTKYYNYEIKTAHVESAAGNDTVIITLKDETLIDSATHRNIKVSYDTAASVDGIPTPAGVRAVKVFEKAKVCTDCIGRIGTVADCFKNVYSSAPKTGGVTSGDVLLDGADTSTTLSEDASPVAGTSAASAGVYTDKGIEFTLG